MGVRSFIATVSKSAVFLALGVSLLPRGPLSLADTPGAGAGDQEGGIAVGTFLKDTHGLMSWLREHNRDLLAASARVAQTREEAAQSRLLPNPTLSSQISDLTVGETNPPGLAPPTPPSSAPPSPRRWSWENG